VLFQKPLITLPAAIHVIVCSAPKVTPHTACCYTAHNLYYSKSHSSHCLLPYRSQFVLYCSKSHSSTACCYTAHSLYCSRSHSSSCLLLYSLQFVLFQKPLITLPAAIQLTLCTVPKVTHHTACCYTAHSFYCSKSQSSFCLLLYTSLFVLFQNPLITLPAAIQLIVCTVPKSTSHTAWCYTAHSLLFQNHSSHCLLLYSSHCVLFQNTFITLPAAIQLIVCTVPKSTHHTAWCYTAHNLLFQNHSAHCLLLYSSHCVLFQNPLIKLPAAI